MTARTSATEAEASFGRSAADAGRFRRNIKWQFVANGAQALLGGAYLIVLGRSLGARDFGVFSVVSALISVAGLLLELRMQDVVARDFYHVDAERKGGSDDGARLIDYFLLEVVSRVLPCLGVILLFGVLAEWTHLPPDAHLLVVLAGAGYVAAKSGWGVATGLLRVLGRTDLIARFIVADWGLRLIVTLCWWGAAEMSVQAALLIALVASGVSNLAQIAAAVREFSRRVNPIRLDQWDPQGAIARVRGARRLLAANLGVSASDLMAKDLDVTLISSILSAEKVGLYKLTKSFVQALWRGVDPFYLAIMPEVRRLWMSKDDRGLWKLLRKTSIMLFIYSVALTVAACTLAALFAEDIVGPGYSGLPALMALMSVWIVFGAPLIWAHPLAVAIDRPEIAVGGSVLGLATGAACFWILTPQLELTGAAIAWVLTLATGFSFTSIAATAAARRLRSPRA